MCPARARTLWPRLAALVAVILLLSAFAAIPLLGSLVTIVLTAIGLGSLLLSFNEQQGPGANLPGRPPSTRDTRDAASNRELASHQA
jgi:hypothetical protein